VNPRPDLAGEDTIGGKIQRRFLAGEWLNSIDMMHEYGCSASYLSQIMDGMKKDGFEFKREHRGNLRFYFSIKPPNPTPKPAHVVELDFSKALEWHVRDLEERVTASEDAILLMAAAIQRRRDIA
jgi:hypothetical protein